MLRDILYFDFHRTKTVILYSLSITMYKLIRALFLSWDRNFLQENRFHDTADFVFKTKSRSFFEKKTFPCNRRNRSSQYEFPLLRALDCIIATTNDYRIPGTKYRRKYNTSIYSELTADSISQFTARCVIRKPKVVRFIACIFGSVLQNHKCRSIEILTAR